MEDQEQGGRVSLLGAERPLVVVKRVAALEPEFSMGACSFSLVQILAPSLVVTDAFQLCETAMKLAKKDGR